MSYLLGSLVWPCYFYSDIISYCCLPYTILDTLGSVLFLRNPRHASTFLFFFARTSWNPDNHVSPCPHLLQIFAQMSTVWRVLPWPFCKFAITLFKIASPVTTPCLSHLPAIFDLSELSLCNMSYFVMFVLILPPLEYKFHGSMGFGLCWSLLLSQQLEQCLTCNRHSINVYWRNQ